jgi:trimethylamine corrinoid protein
LEASRHAGVIRLREALLSLNRAEVSEVLSAWVGPRAGDRVRLADDLIAPALVSIGDDWERGTVALSQVYMAGRMMERALEQHLPALPPRPGAPRVGIGVLEDHHALGKRIVTAVLTSAGYEVIDLGNGLSPVAMVERALEHDVDVLMISVLMLNRALHVAEVRRLLSERGLAHPSMVVGGAPFVHDPELFRRVGADACGKTAADALRYLVAYEGGAR